MSRTPWSELEREERRGEPALRSLADRMGTGPLLKNVVTDLRDMLVGKDALLQILPDITGRELQLRIQMRELPGPERGAGYNLIEMVRAFFRFRLKGYEDDEEITSKERLLDAKALKEEIEAEAAAGRYVPLIDMLDAWQQCFAMIANRVDAVAGRVASELAGVSDAAIIRKRLLEELRSARSEAALAIADWEERLAVALQRGASDDATAAEDAGPVGRSK